MERVEIKQSSMPTPYPELNAVLHALVTGVEDSLGENFLGAYLQGSFAVGEFDPHSDVDFIIAVHQELSNEQLAALQALHPRIYAIDCPWAQHLEGSYFPKDALRDYTQRAKPIWYLDHGWQELFPHAHDNTIVVRWVLREHGVTLAGPSPAALIDPIPVSELRKEILQVMTGWWQEIQANPESINNRFYQTFAVLSYCRMLHDLHTGFPGSKRAGAEWAKAALDPSWRGLIDRTWAGRPDPATSVRTPADPADFQSTLLFIATAVSLAEKLKPGGDAHG